jgi:peptidoglycan/LPS O-acetylase OafA/YrhL
MFLLRNGSGHPDPSRPAACSWACTNFFRCPLLAGGFSRWPATKTIAPQPRRYGIEPSPSSFSVFISHAARSLPLMTVMVLLWIPICLVGPHPQGWKVVCDALLSPSLLCPLVGCGPPFNGPAWAMTVFIFGYAVDAWFGRGLQRMPLRTLWLLLLFLWLSQMLCNGLALFNEDPDITMQPFPPRNFPPVFSSLHKFALLRLLEIVLGMVLSVLYCRSSAIWARHWPVRFGFPLFWAGAIAVMVLAHSGDGRLAFLASHGLLTPLLALLLVAAASDAGPIAYLGRTRCGRLLAEGTLALYLMHLPIHYYA